VTGWKDKRRVMKRYDLTAEMYEERYSEEQATKYRAALENVKLTGGSVLDVGCGTGLFFSHVVQSAGLVVGVDISRKLLSKAEVEAKKSSNVSVLVADADHLPLRDGLFEAAFAFTVLQNMPKPEETLLELERVTKINGSVVVTGLKKAFPLDKFLKILECVGLKGSSFVDSEDLKCYVAVLIKQQN